MSSVEDRDQGLASGINNAASRIAHLAGVALASGVGAVKLGYELGLVAAVICSVGAYIVLISVPMDAVRSNS
jgi:hypothetical protein